MKKVKSDTFNWRSKLPEIIIAIIIALFSFFVGQSYQQIENKALMESKLYMDENLSSFRTEILGQQAEIDKKFNETIKSNNEFQKELVRELLDNSKNIARANLMAIEANATIQEVERAMLLVKRQSNSFNELIENKAGISNRQVADLIKHDLKDVIENLPNLELERQTCKSALSSPNATCEASCRSDWKLLSGGCSEEGNSEHTYITASYPDSNMRTWSCTVSSDQEDKIKVTAEGYAICLNQKQSRRERMNSL